MTDRLKTAPCILSAAHAASLPPPDASHLLSHLLGVSRRSSLLVLLVALGQSGSGKPEAVCTSSLQHRQVRPPSAAAAHVRSSHGQPLARAHCSTEKWQPLAAAEHVLPSHGQPSARAHCSTDRWPRSAAARHVRASHGQPSARSHCSTSRCPRSLSRINACAFTPREAARKHDTDRWPPAAPSDRVHVLMPVATGSHWYEPTAAGAGGHFELHDSTCANSTGSVWHAATAAYSKLARCPLSHSS
jgi:hypothetical protein